MGGDLAPHEVFKAVVEVSKQVGPACSLSAIATPSIVQELSSLNPSFAFIEAPSYIEMGEAPLTAVRRKKESTMAVGMRLLREKRADALVSMGNTGALIATATLNLPLLPTTRRPGLLALLPTERGRVAVLDVGANVVLKPEQLVDLARVGIAYSHLAHGVSLPTVGLLNIGEEAVKGTVAIQEAYTLLQEAMPKQFLGNIESRDVFHGKVDVLVTDGFTGNIFLKTCEGASAFLIDYLEDHFSSVAAPFLSELQKQFDYAEYPGAVLAGVEGLVVKCHGYSSRRALVTGILGALELSRLELVERMAQFLTKY